MEEPEKLLREFLYLNSGKLVFSPKSFQDIYLEGNHLLRRYENTCTIYFLLTSDSIVIGEAWIELFCLFSVEYSGKISEWLVREYTGKSAQIIRFVRLAKEIQSEQLYYKSGQVLNLIEDIVNHGGTGDIRSIIKDTAGLDLGPWQIENMKGSIEV